MKGYDWRGWNRADRIDRAKSALGYRVTYGYRRMPEPDVDSDIARRGIGGNGAPPYDPDQPVTGFPSVMRDIAAFKTNCGMEISSRSELRAYERERGVEQTGMEWTGDSENCPKGEFWDEFKEHRKDRTKRLKSGKSDIGRFSERKAREAKAKKGK